MLDMFDVTGMEKWKILLCWRQKLSPFEQPRENAPKTFWIEAHRRTHVLFLHATMNSFSCLFHFYGRSRGTLRWAELRFKTLEQAMAGYCDMWLSNSFWCNECTTSDVNKIEQKQNPKSIWNMHAVKGTTAKIVASHPCYFDGLVAIASRHVDGPPFFSCAAGVPFTERLEIDDNCGRFWKRHWTTNSTRQIWMIESFETLVACSFAYFCRLCDPMAP